LDDIEIDAAAEAARPVVAKELEQLKVNARKRWARQAKKAEGVSA